VALFEKKEALFEKIEAGFAQNPPLFFKKPAIRLHKASCWWCVLTSSLKKNVFLIA
jgi:hypothetical protein